MKGKCGEQGFLFFQQNFFFFFFLNDNSKIKLPTGIDILVENIRGR
jgi:hypothetical protein